jgi:hypothetical protein
VRADANKIAFRAIRSIVAPVAPFELEVAGTAVTCHTMAAQQPPWPQIQGFDEASDGPWPKPIIVQCTWEGGRCDLHVECWYWQTKGRYRHLVGLRVRLRDRFQELVWITGAPPIGDSPDGSTAQLRGTIASVKRKKKPSPVTSESVNRLLRELVGTSQLPLATASTVEIGKIKVPSAEIEPSPETALHRLIHLALYKLDVLDRGEKAKERGRPLIDVAMRLGGEVPVPAGDDEVEADDDQDPEEEEEGLGRPGPRYWAGGFLWKQGSRLEQFLREGFWEHGFERGASGAPARVTWRRFDQIRVGDLFAIKGYGGNHDLKIHRVAKVIGIDTEHGRLDLEEVQGVPLFNGEAPRGADAGAWRDALVPVTRPDVIKTIFGVETEPALAPVALAPNLILYGPPGTGKTFRLTELMPLFTREAREIKEIDRAAELASELTWFECIAIALKRSGGSAKVDELLHQPILKAKHAQAPGSALRQIVWGTLGKHTVETSTVVKMKIRLGELIFDKEPSGTWVFADAFPERLNDAVERLAARDSAGEQKNYDFITFHQAYAYEDFIEGIRPNLRAVAEDDASGIAYELRDGVFKVAVQSAIRLTGFEGTVDEFCALSRDERARLLAPAPRYAVFIDEVNRGNVARVFGELITLLEPDKRLGAERELIVKLPYSRTRFGIPQNLHVIGTMNTADRSVEALDTALRRRFEFEELAPKPELLDFIIEGQIDPEDMLKAINRRIEKLRDGDHSIGHAYFMPLAAEPSLQGLKRVFKTAVLPLLREYFYGDWGKIGLVLGKDFVVRQATHGGELADFDHDDRGLFEERATYQLADVELLTSASFRRIYEDVPDT